MDQNALTVITKIKPAELQSLKALLNEIGGDINGNKYIRFTDLSTTHFARWVVIDNDGAFEPCLAFESNYDGSLDEYLDELVSKAGSGIDLIYGKCAGYPAKGTQDISAFKKFIRDHSVDYEAFYIAYRGKSVKAIRINTLLRDKIEHFLDEEGNKQSLDQLPAPAIRQRILAFLRREQAGNPDLSTAPIQDASFSRKVMLIVLAAIAILIIFPVPIFFLPLPSVVRLIIFLTPILLLGVWVFILRRHEKIDEQASEGFGHVDPAIFDKENYKVQNQLTHIVNIKPGKFRLITLKAVLGAVNLLARYLYYRGELGTIPTIHFARWVIIDNKRLLFLSNFDGSWENYLGDFIDKASIGLTAIWSNTEFFPKTRFLVLDGAKDEERFKEWGRVHQIPTEVWYSAHPDETVKNILNNVAIRNGIEPSLNGSEVERWLHLL